MSASGGASGGPAGCASAVRVAVVSVREWPFRKPGHVRCNAGHAGLRDALALLSRAHRALVGWELDVVAQR